MPIINFKDTPEVRDALKIAAVKDGYEGNVSRFLSELVRQHPTVKKELGKAKNTAIPGRGKWDRKK